MTSHRSGGPTRHWPLTAVALAGLVPAGCGGKAEAERVPPPPTVTVVLSEKRDVPIVVSAIGTTVALNEFTVRARVSGFLKEGPPLLFQEGSNVAKDQLLFVIDEEPFQAAVASAAATLEQNQAELTQAEQSKTVAISQARLLVSQAAMYLAQVQENRMRRLVERNAATREEYDEIKAQLQQADADVQTKKADLEQSKVTFESNIALAKASVAKAQADLTTAQLDLSYCRMSTPIAGRIGEAPIKVGNYVGAYVGSGLEANTLATVEQLDPMGIDFRPSSRFLPMVTNLVKNGLTVRLFVQGERPYPHEGRLIFLDNRVDPTTSTFLLKASVPNPEETLLPGDYVRINTTIGTYQGAVVVPERAVMEGQAGAVVFVVGADEKVLPVKVLPVDLYEGLRVLESGLEPGQRVIVDGIQLVRPGMKVQTEVVTMDQAVPKRQDDREPIRSRSDRLGSPLAVPNGSERPEAAAPDPPPSPPASAPKEPVATPAAKSE